MSNHNKINYIEIPSGNIEITKAFFSKVFGWSFVDYGPDYCSFGNGGIDGGFYKSDLKVSVDSGSPLIVLYSEDLETTQLKIEQSGGEIVKPNYRSGSLPGKELG